MLFRDVESQRDFYIDPDAVRDEYQRKLESHRQAAEGACRKFGSAFYRITTDQPMDLALRDFLRARSRRGRMVRRRTQHASPP
jgi:uncharacterized protein (DUF58 family)